MFGLTLLSYPNISITPTLFYVERGSKHEHNIVKILQVLFAGSLLKNNSKLHEALITAMANKASVTECIEAIEKAA